MNLKINCHFFEEKNIEGYKFVNYLIKKSDFLIDIEIDQSEDIYNSLYLIGEYMKKNIFVPNNVNYPISRQNFINYFK